MKKIPILSIFLFSLVINSVFSQVTVKIENLTYSTGEIIGKSDTLAIDSGGSRRILFEIALSRPSSFVVNGSVKVFSKRNTTSSPIQIGTSRFLEDEVWFTTFNISESIELFASSFDETGGTIYAEFESTSGIKYTSDSIPIKINPSNGNGGNPGSSIVLSDFKIIDVKYHNAISFSNNTVNIPFEGTTNVTITYEISVQSGNACGGRINLLKNFTNGDQLIVNQNSFNECLAPQQIITFDYNYSLSYERLLNISDVQAVFIPSRGARVLTSSVNINILNNPNVPSIVNNLISARPREGITTFSLLELFPGTPTPNLTGTTDLRHSNRGAGISLDGVFSFQWQQSLNGKWINIPDANGFNYQPGVLSNTTFFRRIASSLDVFSASNVIEARILSFSSENEICCDQNILTGNPSPIIGSNPNLSESFDYIWQVKPRTVWNDIPGSNTKDYTPPLPSGRFGRAVTEIYRRIVRTASGLEFISNLVSITKSADYSTSISSNLFDSSSGSTPTSKTIQIFPNPAKEVIMVDSEVSLKEFNFKILDFNDQIINLNYQFLRDDLIRINTSQLEKGLYFIILENSIKKEKRIFRFLKE